MITVATPTRQKWDEWITLGAYIVRFAVACDLAFIVRGPTALGVALLLFWSITKGPNGD